MTNILLKIDNLSIQFGGLKALKSITFDIYNNQITGLIGPNGAGKTTLFNCITGFYKATQGELFFHHNHNKYNLKKILNTPLIGGSHQISRLGITRTFQNIRLFKEMTALENLLIAQHRFANHNLFSGLFNLPSFQRWEKQAINTAYDWLKIFDLDHSANTLAGELPYGKQRHLEIARAMCTQPILLCLDEPAAGLNPQETLILSDIILNLRKQNNISILLIEHDMSLVMKICDHIIVLNHGEIIAEGNPTQIQNDKKVIKAYLGI